MEGFLRRGPFVWHVQGPGFNPQHNDGRKEGRKEIFLNVKFGYFLKNKKQIFSERITSYTEACVCIHVDNLQLGTIT